MVAGRDVLNNRYRLDQQIGKGGFARVYLGTDLVLKRQVAVKVLNPDLTDDPTFLARFEREALSVAPLEHPHILPIYDYGHVATPTTAYLVMPYVAGGTLQDRLIQAGRLALPEASAHLRQVAAALDYAHAQGIVHRDIKPPNMLLREDGHLFLADFGIAKVLQDTRASSSSSVIGTLAYMAPEQFAGKASPATDVYALGCVLFELLTGEPPYTGPTQQVVHGHLLAPVPSVVARAEGRVPDTLQPIFERALAKRPEDRYPSAGALAQAVQAVAEGNAATMPMGDATTLPRRPPHAAATPTLSLPPAAPRRLVLPAAIGGGVAALLLCAVITFAVAASRRGGASPTATLAPVVGAAGGTATVTQAASSPPLVTAVSPTAMSATAPTATVRPTVPPTPTQTPTPLPPTATPVPPTATVQPITTPGTVLGNTGLWLAASGKLQAEFASQVSMAGLAVQFTYTNISPTEADFVVSPDAFHLVDDEGMVWTVAPCGNDYLRNQRFILKPQEKATVCYNFSPKGNLGDRHGTVTVDAFGGVQNAKWGFVYQQGRVRWRPPVP